MILKRIAILLGFIILVSSCYLLFPTTTVSAKNDIQLYIRVEVSTNNGQTWQNTTGTDYSGGQIAYPCQNDTIQIRTRVWNTGEDQAYQVTGQSSFNPQGFVVGTQTGDSNNDKTGYIREPFTNNGAIYIASVPANTTADNGARISVVTVTLPESCPLPGTQITASANIQNYATNPGWWGQQGFNWGINRAIASGIGNRSSVTFVPCGCESGRASNITVLPKTGMDLLD